MALNNFPWQQYPATTPYNDGYTEKHRGIVNQQSHAQINEVKNHPAVVFMWVTTHGEGGWWEKSNLIAVALAAS